MSEPAKPSPLAPQDEVVSFWDVTKAQYKKNRPAMVALWCVIALVLAAVVAPLIALNVPYVMKTPKGIDWPLAHHLFNRLVFSSGVDVFFNLLLVVLPFWWLGAALIRESGLKGGKFRPARVLASSGLLFGLTLLYLLWGIQERSLYLWFLGFGLLGVGIQFVQAIRAQEMIPRRQRAVGAQTRFALAGLFLLVFCLTLFVWEYTATVPIYRTEIAKLKEQGTGWAWTQPVFYHPDNKADENQLIMSRILQPPSWETRNLLGCDNNGRDVFARILYGARISLTIGIIAVSIYTTIGIILGSLAGFFGGKLDMLIMGMVQVMLCIPVLFLLLTILAVFETRSIFLIMAAIGLTRWTGITRLVRGEFFRQREIDYVTAARALGIPQRRIIFGHILKNAMAPVLVAAAFGVAGAILVESALAFLGLGDTNAPSWGQILMEGRVHRKGWLIYAPGVAIFFVVTILNLVGDGLRDALDPKLRQ